MQCDDDDRVCGGGLAMRAQTTAMRRQGAWGQWAGRIECSSDDDVPEVLLLATGPLLVAGDDVLLRSAI